MSSYNLCVLKSWFFACTPLNKHNISRHIQRQAHNQMFSSTVAQNTNKSSIPPSTSTSRTEASSSNATSVIDGTTTPRYPSATAQSPLNGLPAQHQVAGARRDESLRGIGAWTEALSPEAKVADATAANQLYDSHSPAQSPQASANRDRGRDLLPMERFQRESKREEPFSGRKKL